MKTGSSWAFANKAYRSFPDRVTKKIRLSLNKEWVYYHIKQRCMDTNTIHVCKDFEQEGIDIVLQKGFQVSHGC